MPLKNHRWILWLPYCVMLWITPLKNQRRPYSNSVVLFIQQNMVFDKKVLYFTRCAAKDRYFFHRALGVIPLVLLLFQAAHRGRYQRMSSGRWCLRLGLCSAVSASSRLQKRDARVNSGLHKDKSSPVKLRLFTSDNDKRKLDETRTSSRSDYAPSRSPSQPNLPFITVLHRHKGQRRGGGKVAVCWMGKKERRMKKCVHGPIKTPLWDPFPPCSRGVITITTPHSALSKRLSDTSLPPYLSSHTPSTPPLLRQALRHSHHPSTLH